MHGSTIRCALLIACAMLGACHGRGAAPFSSSPSNSSSSETTSSPAAADFFGGSATAAPVASERTPAPSQATPQDYLEKKEPDKAIEMMKADPKWIHHHGDDECTPLHHAARLGPPHVVEWLLDHGAEVDAVAYNRLTPLHFADDPAIVRLILAKLPDLTLRDAQDETVLQHAVWFLVGAKKEDEVTRWREIVALYAKALGGIDLFSAIILDDLARVKAILEESPELADNFQEESPLRKAASLGRFEICRYLLEQHQVEADDFNRGSGYPIVKEALRYPSVVKLLIHHGADLKTRFRFRGSRVGFWLVGEDATALHYAAEEGVPETIRLLIDNGVDLFASSRDDLQNGIDQTALDVAAHDGKADIAAAIVNHPLFKLAKPGERQALLDRCLVSDAAPDWDDIGEDRPKLVEVLLDKGANANAMVRGITPMQSAASWIFPNRHAHNAVVRRVVDVLIKHGAKMDLFSAVALGEEDQVIKLLAADRRLINARVDGNAAPLHFAVMMNYPRIVTALLKAGADVNVRSSDPITRGPDETPLDRATFWERNEIAQLLIQAGGKRSKDLDAGK
jgi:ankyrin repeat protein